jgi:hypothetical protein
MVCNFVRVLALQDVPVCEEQTERFFNFSLRSRSKIDEVAQQQTESRCGELGCAKVEQAEDNTGCLAISLPGALSG